MRQHRKTKAERDQERREADRLIWDEFRPKLEAAQSFVDALKLVNEAVPPDSPGRKYYSNLGFFLQNFTPPYGSNGAEKVLYLQFIQRLDNAGKLKPGVRETVEQALRSAMGEQGNW